MAKDRDREKPTETPLERTRRLAQKLLAVPKAEIDKKLEKEERERQSRS